MPRATLSLRIPERVWVSALSKRYPDAASTVLAAMPADDTGVGLVEITADSVEPIVAAIDGFESLTSVAVLEARDDRAPLQFETSQPLLRRSMSEAGIPLELPITVSDGEVTAEMTASRERLSELGTVLERVGIGFDLESVTRSVDTRSLLTDDQYDLLAAAVERGYYDTPRTCTLTDLADAVGLAKSTTSETLHRAEGTGLKRFVGDDAGGCGDRTRHHSRRSNATSAAISASSLAIDAAAHGSPVRCRTTFSTGESPCNSGSRPGRNPPWPVRCHAR